MPIRTPGLFWFSFGPRSRVPKITPGISQGGRELKRGASTAISNQGPSDVCLADSVTRLSRRNLSMRTHPSTSANPRIISNVFFLRMIGRLISRYRRARSKPTLPRNRMSTTDGVRPSILAILHLVSGAFGSEESQNREPDSRFYPGEVPCKSWSQLSANLLYSSATYHEA